MSLFHVGPEKTGTTWIFRCLAEHPEIATPPRDSIHYYDILFHRGYSWYVSQFGEVGPDDILFDPTFSYFRAPEVPERIAADNPEARLVACLRHPVDRAFSHYWHEKKKGRYNYRFSEVLENYDLFLNWLGGGHYALHLRRFLRCFPRRQILVQRMDDLRADPGSFLRRLLEFADVNPAQRPSVLHTRVNVAAPAVQPSPRTQALKTLLGSGWPLSIARWMVRHGRRLGVMRSPTPRIERLSEQPPALLEELGRIVAPQIEELEDLLEESFAEWKSWEPVSE